MTVSRGAGTLAFLLVFLPVTLAIRPVRSIWSDQGEPDGWTYVDAAVPILAAVPFALLPAGVLCAGLALLKAVYTQPHLLLVISLNLPFRLLGNRRCPCTRDLTDSQCVSACAGMCACACVCWVGKVHVQQLIADVCCSLYRPRSSL